MLLGLGHDRIVYLGSCYIERGYITQDEYENLHDYLYEPYLALGGNGTAKKVMAGVERLPLHKKQGGINPTEKDTTGSASSRAASSGSVWLLSSPCLLSPWAALKRLPLRSLA